jgi:molecular chaperone DnaJ
VPMAQKRCYYEVLEIERSAADRDISRAYRKLAIKYHPDSNPNDEQAATRFKEAAEAYEILSDRDKRARYDRYGHAGVDSQAHQFQSAEDIFSAFGEIFGGGIFSDFFGGGRGRGRRVRRGADVRADVSLTLEEAATGAKKTIQFSRMNRCETCNATGSSEGSQPETCKHCGGHGQVLQSNGILRVQTRCSICGGSGHIITDPCHDCHGNGYVSRKVNLDVSIPAGVDDGMRVRLTGEGEPSPDGGPAGDCYCFISVKRHKLFHRDGKNLIVQFPIAYTQAALGAEVEVPTLAGPEGLTIPRGTQSGEVFKLAGFGMPDPQGGRKGDLLVQTFIETPKKLNKAQEDLLRELAELEHTNVSPQRKKFFDKIKDYFAISTDK